MHLLPPDIYTLSLHDALPILSHNSGDEYAWLSAHGYGKPSASRVYVRAQAAGPFWTADRFHAVGWHTRPLLRQRSEEHTSELQSRENLVCRLLLEKKNT